MEPEKKVTLKRKKGESEVELDFEISCSSDFCCFFSKNVCKIFKLLMPYGFGYFQ